MHNVKFTAPVIRNTSIALEQSLLVDQSNPEKQAGGLAIGQHHRRIFRWFQCDWCYWCYGESALNSGRLLP